MALQQQTMQGFTQPQQHFNWQQQVSFKLTSYLTVAGFIVLNLRPLFHVSICVYYDAL